MAKQSKLLIARNNLKARCNNYFGNLYNADAFSSFREYAKQEHYSISNKILENEKLKPEYQMTSEALQQLVDKQAAINSYLQEQDDLLFVINCLDNQYTPEEYTFSTYGFSEKSVLPQLKSLKNLLNCFDLQASAELTPDIAKEQIKTFEQNFLKEKTNFKFDTAGQKFLEAIGHILSTIVTAGFYAGFRAAYSLNKRNSVMFWESQPELMQRELDSALKAIEVCP